jgi:hypothetical protein
MEPLELWIGPKFMPGGQNVGHPVVDALAPVSAMPESNPGALYVTRLKGCRAGTAFLEIEHLRINKPHQIKPRTQPVSHGRDSHGKRRLVGAVMECGVGLRLAEKAVNAVVESWKRAILAKDQHIEMPIGHLKVKKTPRNLYRKRYTKRVLFGKPINRLISWTIYNDPYRIIWRVPEAEWDELLLVHNPPSDALSEQEVSARRSAASIEEELKTLFDAVYCQPDAQEMDVLLDATGGKERLLQTLQAVKRTGRRYGMGQHAHFLAEIVYRRRMLRESERRDG